MYVGLITYHAAYNYGSVLQTYATQQSLRRMEVETEIINYRMLEQKRYYNNLLRTKYGIKICIMDCNMLPMRGKRKLRAERFENFFQDFFHLPFETAEPEEVAEQWQQYDSIISGSDQIWNKHSCELEHNAWRYMDPYLLKGFNGRKISYASSVGNMTDDELQQIVPALRQFDALAFRESVSAEKMAALLDRPIETVLDPTFLLTKDDWIVRLQLQKDHNEKYILAYFLCGPKRLAQLLPVLSRFAKKRDCKVQLVTPFAYLPCPNRRIEYHPEFGPIEFLNALYNAEAVVTDSYHGTILSVNFGKEFYSVCKSGGAEFRKTDILGRLGLLDRVVDDIKSISESNVSAIDYDSVYKKLDGLRQHSFNYLKTALEG